jgi:hypothetical protein
MDSLSVISYIKRGRNRRKVFIALDKPMMPSELLIKVYGKKSNTYFNIISRALAELAEYRLVEVLNPKEKTGRIYQKTKLGEQILIKVK